MNKRIKIEVVEGDATSYSADVLILKYAQRNYGLDHIVSEKLTSNLTNNSISPQKNHHQLLSSENLIKPKNVLFTGVEILGNFRYKEIREFAYSSLKFLSNRNYQHICLTIHGAGYGLDIEESFEAEIAGIIDAITTGKHPRNLEKITIIEISPHIATELKRKVQELIPTGFIETNLNLYLESIDERKTEKYKSVGYFSDNKPHIFVAMPFKENMDDVYHYGILNSVRNVGFLCERADISTFTGDIMQWIRERIKSSSLVIADLTGASPNVYLELGYAWGSDIPSLLLSQDPDELTFDVNHHKCLVYKRIKDLEKKLTRELIELKDKNII